MSATKQDALLEQILHPKIQVGASFIKRVGARLVDQSIFVVFTLLLYFVLLQFNDDKDAVGFIALMVALAIHMLFYLPFFELKGGTPGKRALRLKSISYLPNNLGGNPSVRQVVKRTLFIHWPVIVIGILALYYEMTKLPYTEPAHGLDAILLPDPARDERLRQIRNFSSMTEFFKDFYILMLALLIPLSMLMNKYKLGWHDQYSKIAVVSEVAKPATLDAPTSKTFKLPTMRLPKWNIKVNKEIFTSKIAYMVYALLFILIILFVKYQLDVMKEEKHFELKREYEDR